jgi:gamma-glutamyltranspeptidase/glutathione hydrolase
MVVSADSLASYAGLEVLQRGGNAVDAAVAVGFTLAVTYPEAGNIGGGGFMLIRLADGRTTFLDFRETAPAAATKDMFLSPDGQADPHLSRSGPLSAGIPGTVAGLLMALELHGTMDRGTVLKRSIELAERGFRVDARLAENLNRFQEYFSLYPGSRRIFSRDDRAFAPGDLLVQEDLGRTLRRISDKGTSGFYQGEVAQQIVKEMQRGAGIITLEDLHAYAAVERSAISATYRDYTVITAPPPSAGGLVLLQTLNILECYPLGEMMPDAAATLHLIASAEQCAFADRYRFAADPDHVAIPVEELISDNHARAWAGRILAEQASPSDSMISFLPGPPEGSETTHYAVIDQQGNIVSASVTLNDYFGSKTVVSGAGFFLNNEMDDFTAKVDAKNLYGLSGGAANIITPGKRMASSMAPTIVLEGNEPVLVLGGRGGSKIPTAVAQVIINYLDFRFDPTASVRRARIHHQWRPDTIVYEEGVPSASMQGLRNLGWDVSLLASSPGRIQAIAIVNGILTGVSDPREGGTAAGY